MKNGENESDYTPNNTFKKAKPVKTSSGFGRTVFVPFVSGVLGAGLVIGACFGVPQIKNCIVGNQTTPTSSIVSTPQSTTYTNTLIDLSDYSDTAVAVAQKVLPSVVGIKVSYSVSSVFGKSAAEATGSGIILSEDGYIVTNNHVISTESTSSYYQITEATGITVTLYGDETEYPATVVGSDALSDLAVLKIDKTDLPAAKTGNSDDLLVGEFVMAIGNPLGMDSSITCGVVSALNREVKDDTGKVYNVIQTDAAINSGNSGGALVNSKGEVIGINTLKLAGSGIEGMGFAIPINSTTSIINQLTEYGEVKRPYIGIEGYSVKTSVSEIVREQYSLPDGIYVSVVEKDSPAEQAGIEKGDIITKINGTEVHSITELNNEKNKNEVGAEVTLTIIRKQEEKEIKVTLGETPSAKDTDKKDEDKKEDNSNQQQEQQYQYYDPFGDDFFNSFFGY